MARCGEEPFFPMITPPFSLPTFITLEISQLSGLNQRKLFFYYRNALEKTSCSLNLCHKMEQAPPQEAGCACPCLVSCLPVLSSLAHPACLSLGCPLLKKLTCKGSPLLPPHQGPCLNARCGFSTSSRNSRLTIYHD